MEMPREGAGWDTLANEYGVFHLARMLADPKTKGLCAAFQARQDALEAKGQAFNASWKAQSRADAALKRSDLDMDNLVRELYFDKIAACVSNYKCQSRSELTEKRKSQFFNGNCRYHTNQAGKYCHTN